jgi:hypothetical protein
MNSSIQSASIATAVSLVFALIASLVTWGVWEGDDTKEIATIGFIIAGFVIGLVIVFLIRVRNPYGAVERNACESLRAYTVTLSFLAITPTTVSIAISLIHSDFGGNEFMLISAIMIFVSMILQAVYWKKVQCVGRLSGAGLIMLYISLLLLNVSSILAIDNGSVIMLLVSIVASVSAVILMFDWRWSSGVALPGSLASFVVFIIMGLVEGPLDIGPLLIHLLPLLFIFLIRNSLMVSTLVYNAKSIS